MTTRDTPEAALAAILDREIARWQRAEAGTQRVTLAQYLAAILAALDGWTLVRDLDWAAGVTAIGREKECEAEIERLQDQIARQASASPELAAAFDAVRAAHKPGDSHRYRITCEVCGERGTIRLTVDPETALAPAASEPG
jgi:hypothetical protein